MKEAKSDRELRTVGEWSLESLKSGEVYIVGSVSIAGRLPECEIVVPEGYVSRAHAKFTIEGERFVVEDLGSRNGTLVNGRAITKERLKDGDEVEIGNDLFRVKYRPAEKKSEQTVSGKSSEEKKALQNELKDRIPESALKNPPVRNAEAKIEPPAEKSNSGDENEETKHPVRDEIKLRNTKWWEKPSSGPKNTEFIFQTAANRSGNELKKQKPSGMTGPELVGVSDHVKGRRILLKEGSIIIGRSPECDHTVESVHVSHKHAQIIYEKKSVSVVNLPNSTNGTFVNNVRAGGRIYLSSGDLVRFGNTEFIFWFP